eukprot:2513208-Alexandrium_andersonii.AAC.1
MPVKAAIRLYPQSALPKTRTRCKCSELELHGSETAAELVLEASWICTKGPQLRDRSAASACSSLQAL